MDEIEQLSHTYAAAADRADGEAVAALFIPDGRLVVSPPPPAETVVHEGSESIAGRIAALRRYDRTDHTVAAHRSEVTGTRATGVTECVAHHYGGEAGSGMDRIVPVRYDDRYVFDDGRWMLEERHVHMHSDEISPVATNDTP